MLILLTRSYKSLFTQSRWRNRLLIAATALLAVGSSVFAGAQANATANLPDGLLTVQYIGSHISPAAGSTQPAGWLYGVNSSLEFKSNRWWGFEAEGSAAHWNVPIGEYFGGVGPQFVLCEGRFRFHALTLAGVSRGRLVLPHNQVTDPEYGPAVRGGGGADIRISRHVIVRLGEVYFTEAFLKQNLRSIDYSQGFGFVF